MKRYKTLGAVLLVSCALVIAGCATIVNGSSQQISIASKPSGAEVLIDGADVGDTPLTQKLSRKDQHTIELKLDGYESESIIVNKGVSGWIAGNILFGGLIGLAVDAATGAMYKLDPTEIQRSLDGNTSASAELDDDLVHVTIVMKPNPDWEKIGELTPRSAR